MRPLLARTLAAALIAAPAAGCSAQGAPKAAAPVDAAFGEKVRAYLLDHPEVVQQAMERLQARQEEAAAAVARLGIAKNRPALERDAADPSIGPAAAKVTLVEFFDYRCPYCKASAPEIPALLKRHPDVRMVFKEFPILSPESEAAAKLALASAKQGKYAAVHLGLMKAPKLDDATVTAVLSQAGVDVARAKADAASPAVAAKLEADKALAREVGVTGTPAFVVGDRVENGWSAATLEADLAEAGSKPAAGPPALTLPPHAALSPRGG